MRKALIVALLLLLCLPFMVFAAQYHSLPIGHEAYRMIEVAETRGAIPVQTDVRPYNVNLVRKLLTDILSSDSFSASEKEQVNRVLDELDALYGSTPTSGLTAIIKKGYLRTQAPYTVALGGRATMDFIAGRDGDGNNVLDARLSGTAYVAGDLFDFMSYDLNFKVNVDKVDIKARPLTDLKINSDGFYFDPTEGGIRMERLPDDHFYLGIEQFSEISLSFKDEMFTARIGTVNRDWGPGFNNIALSGSARAFEGFEMSFKPAKWFTYSVGTGALGIFPIETVNGVEWPSEPLDQSGKYSNNISIHRVELGPVEGLKFGAGVPASATFGIWESVIWRKRMELSYLNPFTIYMFAQNALGDYDNVLAGFDFTFTIFGVGQFYAALSMDELNNYNLFANPRNILSYQFGARFSPKILDFTELTVQATIIPAFYGSHYSDTTPLFGDVVYNIAYVNKGQNISYPLYPDSIELLANIRTSFGSGWKLNVTLKEQLRSAQYATSSSGTDILTTISYYGYDFGPTADFGGYYKRDFFSNIWNTVLNLDATVEKSFSAFPLTLSAGIIGIWERSRTFEPIPSEVGTTIYYPGKVNFTGDWVSSVTVSAKFGAHIYY